MTDEVDADKKEQERLLRVMNKGTRRGGASATARPMSWNVQLSGRAVAGTAASKQQQEDALRALHDQIKKEDANKTTPHTNKEVVYTKEDALNIAAANAARADQPHLHKSPPTTPTDTAVATVTPHNLEDQAEINAFNAFNEQRELERLSKWTRGTGAKSETEPKKHEPHLERPIPAVLMRQFDVETAAHTKPETHHSPQPTSQATAQSKELPPKEPAVKATNHEFHQGVVKFSNNVTIAAKALKQEKSEALVSACISVVASAKVLADIVEEDREITSWTKALEATTNHLQRIVADSGRSGHELYNEISNSLGQLYLSVVSLD